MPEDYPVTAGGKHPPEVLMFNAVGGSSIHWTGHFPRFRPSDFRVRALDGVADDWPISYEDLEPYYEANDREIGVAGLAGDPGNPPRKERPTPPLPLGVLGETIARTFDKLGWGWWVSDNAIISRNYDGRPACTLHGKCMFGCPIGAKASAAVNYWPKAINGVGTPRLLLNSKSKLFPDGLANSSGLVGKNFMLHPFRMIEGVFEAKMDGWIGPFGVPLMTQHFYETDLKRGFVRGYIFQIERSFGPLHQAWGGFAGKPTPWGRDHHRVMKRRFGHVIRVTLLGTARMGDNPKRSVVNSWHQAHDVKNLFIVDGSSFVTSAGVNPTSTIGALALRAADGIWERRREWQ